MNDHYKMIIASDVSDRDGLGLELHDRTGEIVAEVFRDDRTGERRLTLNDELPVDVVEWLLESAKRLL